jgi:outer membrane lipoprotein carrier protein
MRAIPRYFLLLPLLAFGGTTLAQQDDPVARLEALLAASDSIHARFHQVLLDTEGEAIQEADGELWIMRPDRFRWDYSAPFDQLIVSDGVKVWIYDRELAQVTVRPIDAALASSPAALLAGGSAIRESFEVLETSVAGRLTTVSLAPLSQDTDFDRVDVTFSERRLHSLRLSDALDQTTLLELTEVQRGIALDAELFRFQAPEGVDVLGADGGDVDDVDDGAATPDGD